MVGPAFCPEGYGVCQKMARTISYFDYIWQILTTQSIKKKFIDVFTSMVYSSTFKNLSLPQYEAIQNQSSIF